MMTKNNEPKNEISRSFRKAAPYLNIGYTLIGAIIFFAFAGSYIDKKTQSGPLYLIIGVFIGLILGFYNMIKVIHNLDNK